MNNVTENTEHDTTDNDEDTQPNGDKLVESVTPNERRVAIDSIMREVPPQRVVYARVDSPDQRILEAIGRDAVEPRGELYEREGDVLCSYVAHAARNGAVELETQLICRLAEALFLGKSDGTEASRVQLLRAVAAFVLHDHANWHVLCARGEVQDAEAKCGGLS